jgi:hypothetical protein
MIKWTDLRFPPINLLNVPKQETVVSTKNDITGDSIQSRGLSEEGRDNWQKIFGKEKTEERTFWKEELFGNIEVVTHTKRLLIDRAMEKLYAEYPQTLEALEEPDGRWNWWGEASKMEEEDLAKKLLEWSIMMDFLRNIKYEDYPVEAAEELYNSFK